MSRATMQVCIMDLLFALEENGSHLTEFASRKRD
jgi:hypothetical protein